MTSAELPSLEQFRGALNESAIVAVTDRSGKIVDCNEKFCEISGFSKEEIIGQNHRIINSGYHERSFFKSMYKIISSGRVWKGTICNRRKDGSLYWVDTTIVPTMDTYGKVSAYVAIRFEVTGHVAALEELEAVSRQVQQAADAKDQFLANMSHEVRTPLNGIIGLAGALVSKEIDPLHREMAELILNSGESLRRILDDVLDLARVEAGQMTIESRAFNLHDEIKGTAELMRIRADEKGLTFGIEFDDRSKGYIEADPLRIRQILSNLISNAIKFTDEGRVLILVSIEDGGDQPILTIEVEDTGIGFDEDAAANLFDRFVQADGSIARRYGGTGLGLAISNSLAKMMHGTLTARSTLGKGSTFQLTVPVRIVASFEDASQPVPSLEGISDRLRILVAEDHPTNQLVIKHLLEPMGANVTIVDDGEKAVTAASVEGFDIILMDMQMPVMDGLTAIRMIREREDRLGIVRTPIAMLTANTSELHRSSSADSGANAFIAKPITTEILLRGINELLTLRTNTVSSALSNAESA